MKPTNPAAGASVFAAYAFRYLAMRNKVRGILLVFLAALVPILLHAGESKEEMFPAEIGGYTGGNVSNPSDGTWVTREYLSKAGTQVLVLGIESGTTNTFPRIYCDPSLELPKHSRLMAVNGFRSVLFDNSSVPERYKGFDRSLIVCSGEKVVVIYAMNVIDSKELEQIAQSFPYKINSKLEEGAR